MFRSLLFWSPKLSNPDNCFISEWVEGRADKRPESVSRVVGVQGGRLWGARVLDLLRYGQVGVTWLVLSGVGWPAGKVELFIWHNICCYILKYVGTYNNYTRLDWIRWGEQGQAYFPPVPLLMQEPRHAPGGILWSPYWILWEHAVIWCLFSSWRSDTFDPDASLESIGRCPELNRPKHESILEWRGKLEIVNKEPWFKIRSSHYRTETWFDKIWIISGRMLAPWSSLAVVRVTLGLFIMTACGGDISISIIVSNNISTNVIISISISIIITNNISIVSISIIVIVIVIVTVTIINFSRWLVESVESPESLRCKVLPTLNDIFNILVTIMIMIFIASWIYWRRKNNTNQDDDQDDDGGCAGLQPELRGRERESVQSCPGIHHQALGGMTMMIDNHHDHDQKSL